jgi:large conductance mechanosensitive channel
MKNVLNGFKDFIARGNAIDLAVAVILGAAFGAIVKAIIDGLISPLIGLLFGKADLSQVWDIDFNGAHFSIGLVLNAILQFVLIAAAVYFLIVTPINRLAERRKKGLVEEPTAPAEDVLLLQEIRDLLAGQTSPAVRNDAAPGTAAGPAPTV